MRRKIILGFLGCLIALGIVAAAAWNVNINSKTESLLSDIALANIEALANNENGGGSVTIYKCYKDNYDPEADVMGNVCEGGENPYPACPDNYKRMSNFETNGGCYKFE